MISVVQFLDDCQNKLTKSKIRALVLILRAKIKTNMFFSKKLNIVLLVNRHVQWKNIPTNKIIPNRKVKNTFVPLKVNYSF